MDSGLAAAAPVSQVETPAPNYVAAPDCKDRIESTKKTLSALRGVLPRSGGLPNEGGLPAKVRGPIVGVDRESFSFEGEQFEHAPAGLRRLGRAIKKASQPGDQIYLFADKSLPVRYAFDALGAVPDDRRLALAVIGGSPFPYEKVKPSTTWGRHMLKNLSTLRAGEYAEFLTESLSLSVGSCEPAREAFNATSWHARQKRVVREKLLAGALECECKGLDIDGLAVGILLTFSDWTTTGYVQIAKPPLPKSATIADLAKALASPP